MQTFKFFGRFLQSEVPVWFPWKAESPRVFSPEIKKSVITSSLIDRINNKKIVY